MIAYLASSRSICVTADVSIHRLLGTGFDTPVTLPACETASSHQTAPLWGGCYRYAAGVAAHHLARDQMLAPSAIGRRGPWGRGAQLHHKGPNGRQPRL